MKHKQPAQHHKMTKKQADIEADKLLELARGESMQTPLFRHAGVAKATRFESIFLSLRLGYGWFRYELLGSDDRGPFEKLFWIVVIIAFLSALFWLIGIGFGGLLRPMVSSQ